MKKIYLTCLTVLAIESGLQAQLTLTKAANEPVSGDSWATSKFDSTTALPKNTGTGQLWNFSTLTANSSTQIVTYTTSSGTPGYSVFPSSTLAEYKGGSEVGYYNTSGANFEFQGFFDSNGPTVLNLSNTGVMAAWPVSYGSVYSDPVYGNMTSGTTSVVWSGSVTTSAVGSGTVILPGGNMFSNCLLVVTDISLQVGSSDSFSEKKYSFYHSSLKFPLAEFTYEASTSGTVTSKDFSFKVTQSALVTSINEVEKSNANLIVYPNPANNWVNIDAGLNQVTNIEVLDFTGKVLLKESNTKTIDVSCLAPGLYLIAVDAGSRKIIKRLAVID